MDYALVFWQDCTTMNLKFRFQKNSIKEVGKAIALWRKEASNLKINKREIDRMASAFEHEDFQKT